MTRRLRRYRLSILAVVVAALLLHAGYLVYTVSRRVAENARETSSILYGRPLEIRKGDHLGNLRFPERLRALAYKKVAGQPSQPGTYAEEAGKIRLFSRANRAAEPPQAGRRFEMEVQDGRVTALASQDGSPLEAIRLEPEEIGRIQGPKNEARQQVPLSAISPFLQNAVIASEDARFYSHIGIDVRAIGRALWANLRERRFAQGGSTITQQLAKNLFLSPQKTIGRKLHEAELALIVEWRYSKKEILEMYLNKIYFGQGGSRGIYGIEEAAAFYFAKPAKDLTLDESALLAGTIRSPNRYSLLKEPKAAKARRNAVLTKMRQLDMIGEEEFRKAANAPVRTRTPQIAAHEPLYFIDYLQRVTENALGEELYDAGYRYYTTLDPGHQSAAEEAVAKGLAEIEKTALPADEPLQAALVAIDPATGEITALVGGRRYGESQFNRATDAKRQPGSAFKPFVLLAALSQAAQGKGNATLSTPVSGEPLSLPVPEGSWRPANFGNEKVGKITIRRMIEASVNTAAVRLAMDVGLQDVVKTAHAAGITSPLAAVPSLALGSCEVTPLELAYAYAALASGGVRFTPFPFHSVTTADGEVLLVNQVRRERAIDPRAAYLTGYALEGVLERGTAQSAKTMGISFPAAGKTGTTDGNRDSWFVGYTPELVCAVWVGYDSGKDTGLTGATGALRIWTRFMGARYSQAPPPARTPPAGVETAVIDPESGFLATGACPETLIEAYLAGTAPGESCPLHPENPAARIIRKGAKRIGDFFRNLFN
ncbi:MAG: PBP1A family penicillin-binding protein [Deltaproteobacteria bacterium]|nr:PBP1A family penicillin-binding protein [Deltaproteobacteria bacterium]